MVFWLQWQRQWMAFTSYPQIFTNRSQEILHFPCPIHFGQHEASGWHWQRLSGSREPTALRTLAESYFNLAGQETSAPPAVMKFLFLPRLHLAASVIGSPLFSAHCQEGGGARKNGWHSVIDIVDWGLFVFRWLVYVTGCLGPITTS